MDVESHRSSFKIQDRGTAEVAVHCDLCFFQFCFWHDVSQYLQGCHHGMKTRLSETIIPDGIEGRSEKDWILT